MQGWWRTVLRLRFFYLRELLLGVLVWERKLRDSIDEPRANSPKFNRGNQVQNKNVSRSNWSEESFEQEVITPVTIRVTKVPREQEIFSSDKYQQSVNQGLVGRSSLEERKIINKDKIDYQSSSWVAVSAMLEKRKLKLVKSATKEGDLVKVEEESEKQTDVDFVNSQTDALVIEKSRSTLVDFSRPNLHQFLTDLFPIGLSLRLLLRRPSSAKSQKKFRWKASNFSLLRFGHSQSDRKKDLVKSKDKKSRVDSIKTKKRLGYWLSWLLIAGGVLIAIIYLVPDLYFKIAPADVIKLGEVKGTQNDLSTKGQATPTPTPTPYIPPIDPDLPAGQWLIIREIGVKTQPKATDDPEIALKNGVWISPDYGQIGQPGLPIIMAAHRFGWKWWWQSDYWKLNSFYNLPETKPGTIVELIADQRKWTYLIYGGEEGDAITDYNADLILYTCKFLNSPVRHIRYARLIDPNRPELALGQSHRPLSDEEKTELGKLFALPY